MTEETAEDTLRILVVDDEPAVLDVYRRILQPSVSAWRLAVLCQLLEAAVDASAVADANPGSTPQ